MYPTPLGATGKTNHTGGRMAGLHTFFASRNWLSRTNIASEVSGKEVLWEMMHGLPQHKKSPPASCPTAAHHCLHFCDGDRSVSAYAHRAARRGEPATGAQCLTRRFFKVMGCIHATFLCLNDTVPCALSQAYMAEWHRFFVCVRRSARVGPVGLLWHMLYCFILWTDILRPCPAAGMQELWNFQIWGKGVRDHYHPPTPLLAGPSSKKA